MPSPILYKIHSNTLPTDTPSFHARVVPNTILGPGELVKKMLNRGSTFSEADLRGAIYLYEEVIMQALEEGNHVNTGLFKSRPSIKGTFRSKTDLFDPARHTLEATLTPGTELARRMKLASAKRTTGTTERKPMIQSCNDHNSGTRNKTLTPGGIGEITGTDLNFDLADAACGIFFILTASGKETRVQIVPTLLPSQLIFQIPPLEAGNYQLVVRKSYGRTKILRQGTANDTLSVL